VNYYDYIIVGSGIAGLYTALQAKEHGSVLIMTKGSIEDCNTRHAQGGIAAAISANDSSELHYEDTIAAGSGLCDKDMVKILVEEAPARIADLVRYGVPFDTLDGKIALAMEAAHSLPRILHAGGDCTGEHIEVTLSRLVRENKIPTIENSLGTEIIVEDGAVAGIKMLDCRTGGTMQFGCKYLVLATGGGGQLYKFNTNSAIATCDGIALAYNAGAEITDMEFFQFHPTALRIPGIIPFLISEAVRGEGGILRNIQGVNFMHNYHADGDLAPRDIVARSIIHEMRKTSADRVFIDITHLPAQTITTRFPHIYSFCREHGLDITKHVIPVAPAAHYMMGGILTNKNGETSIKGLFATGETACTGVHGANRLASNSLLEAMVFSGKIVESTVKGRKHNEETSEAKMVVHQLSNDKACSPNVPPPSMATLQKLLWENAGIIREKAGLEQAANVLACWQKILPKPIDRHTHEMSNLILAGRLLIEAALLREESRGAHYRTDFTESLPEWQCHLVFKK